MQSSSAASFSHQVEHDRVLRKFFYKPSTPGTQGQPIDIEGWDEDQGPSTKRPAVSIDGIPSFKMSAKFNAIESGSYTIRWRMKVLKNFSIPKELRFFAIVRYCDEPGTAGALGAVLSQEVLSKRAKGQARQYDMVLEESVVVQPHTGHANIELSLFGDKADEVYFGFGILYADIRPTTRCYKGTAGQVEVPSIQPGPLVEQVNYNCLIVTRNYSLSIFRASLDKWDHIKSIPLEDSITMGFGRMACMMMDSIGSKAFMWMGKEEKCCISKLDDGSNISQISSAENMTFIHPTTLQGFATMALSPDGSIVALADNKGTVTTYYTDSGVAIIDRSFPECSIEHIGFHGNNHQLYVVTRNKDADLRCRIIDARQPTYELTGSKIPIPVGGSTIFAFFQEHKLRGQGVFCEASGKSINCYNLYSPRSTDKAKAKVADSSAITQQSLIDQNITYHLRADIHKELLMEEDGASNGIFWVEPIEENLTKRTQRIVFFIRTGALDARSN
ncbi:MAG: hypothetical protein J3Q66DRAFT_364620 [Benniella sp.]|nr:MAG: hypothetical protein J3Q66DRAFT_364620 [Benniella sp.]